MRLTVLGNNGPYPGPGGACSGYLIQEGHTNILMDCGSGVLSNLQKFIPIEELDAIFLTHLHYDHMADMLVLRYALQRIRSENINIGKLKVFTPAQPTAQFDLIKSVDDFDVNIIATDISVDIAGIKITFGEMKHPVQCYGISMEKEHKKFVYSGDTSWDNNIIDFFRGADLLLIDSGLRKRDKTSVNVPHLTADECGKVARESGVKKMLITHTFPEYEVAELLKEAKTNFSNTEAALLLETYEI